MISAGFARYSALFLLVAATLLAGLSLAGWSTESKRAVVDVTLVVDVTQSMNVKDLKLAGRAVSRLEFVKRASQSMLLRWPCGSKLALAMFSGHRSFVLFNSVEICAHHDELWSAIESLDWRSAWVARSEVSKGLFSAMKIVPEVGRSTRLIFVSDGHEAPPLHEKYRPKLSSSVPRSGGIVVGVGGDELSRIPKFGPNGESQGYWRASEVMQVDSYRMGRTNGEALVGVDHSDLQQRLAAGREHFSQLKQEHLQSLSLQTGMHYATADTLVGFQSALLSPVLWKNIDARQELAPMFTSLALLCLIARLLLPLAVTRSS